MAHNGAPHPATRSATCHRPRVRSQPRGGTRGGPAAGGRLVTVLRTPRAGRGAHLYSSLEPLEVPWPASTSYRVPHGGLLRGSSHPTPTPAPGKLPCDPNWPLQPVITAPVWFFFLVGGSSGFTETTYSRCVPFYVVENFPGQAVGGHPETCVYPAAARCSSTSVACPVRSVFLLFRGSENRRGEVLDLCDLGQPGKCPWKKTTLPSTHPEAPGQRRGPAFPSQVYLPK